jgi:hypothetical protein
MGPTLASDIDDYAPWGLHMIVTASDGSRWLFSAWANEQNKLTWLFYDRGYKAGVTLRSARPEDAPALTEVELQSPIQRAEGTFVYDRGNDYFASIRLMEQSWVHVAEYEEKLIAFGVSAAHRARVGGKDLILLLGSRLRSLPEHRGGLYMALSWKITDTQPRDFQYSYRAVDTDFERKVSAQRPQQWLVQPLRMTMPCRRGADTSLGRRATPDDAPAIVDILNRYHDGEEMYLPHTHDSWNARLTRAPDVYSWDSVWLHEGAVLGVWPAAYTALIDRNGEARKARTALILDHGFVPGSEAAFESLLQSCAARLVEQGAEEVAWFTSEPSAAFAIFSRLATSVERFAFSGLQVRGTVVPPPDGHEHRGFYVDPIYF